MAEEERGFTNNSPNTSAAVPCDEDDKEEDEELILVSYTRLDEIMVNALEV